eukprot:gb/GFBE01000571.1/.p1 GENE.gb/GFBE01000571.1/~~gb/GFBE01000571.1/.p1  ORF type:complete len:332 (+),score=56.89 gb/GFBE01000571.1/:1-996(+)
MMPGAIAAALWCCLLQNAYSMILPDRNSLSQLREQSSSFNVSWAPHSLISGELQSREAPSDLFVGIPFSLEVERDFFGPDVTAWCRTHWHASYIAAALYLVLINIGPAVMKDRPAWNLKTSLALWNLFLAVFSLIGALRAVPQLLGSLHNFGFVYTVCRTASPHYGSGPVGLWVCLFIFSKYAELFDTFFLVVRKKRIGFLHWYHHFSVLLYCWHAYTWEMPTGLYFTAMNYSVHAIMYFYYFLAGVMAKPPKWALLVTILQLAQMIVGIIVTCSHMSFMLSKNPATCDGHLPNLQAALAMYASYFLLFAKFFVERYCLKRTGEKPGKKQM